MDHIVCIIVTLYLLLSKQHYLEDHEKSCTITFSHLNSEPIVLSSAYQFLYPEPHTNLISVDLLKEVIISCPGGNIIANGTQFDTLEKAYCLPGNQFTINTKNIDFNQIMCTRQPLHTARLTQKIHETEASEIEIGFNVTDEIFIPQIFVYFNENNLSPLYSVYNLTKSIGNYETNIARPNHFNKDFYVNGADDLFDKDRQRRTINNLIGLSVDSTKYIKNGSNYFLSRGHLTPKSGFFFGAQQRATFYYVNVAPQWESFNSGNWKQVEQDVKEYARVNQVDLVIYTGTYGITTLQHETTGEKVPLFLYTLNGHKKIPVPELYWKVVYDPVAKRGIVLLGINNPYQENIYESIICNDISSSVKWLHWDANKIESGYSYACTVEDFSTSVPYLPYLKINGILF